MAKCVPGSRRGNVEEFLVKRWRLTKTGWRPPPLLGRAAELPEGITTEGTETRRFSSCAVGARQRERLSREPDFASKPAKVRVGRSPGSPATARLRLARSRRIAA